MTTSELIWRKALIPATASVAEVIRNLVESGLQIALVVSAEGVLQGTVTDGDIRRGLLRGLTMEDAIDSLIHRQPLVVTPDLDREQIIALMRANRINQVPIVDKYWHVLGLHTWDEIDRITERPNTMVIMAGGKGRRLLPMTADCPKPMLAVAGKPMLEHIILKARAEGFTQFVLAVNYLAQQIKDYFGDGRRWAVDIDYIQEDLPLGTAGALSLLRGIPDYPIVVSNGDVMTDVRYGDLVDFHARHQADATMAVRQYEWQHPFGVVSLRGVQILGIDEKPIHKTYVNAGIYTLQPGALALLESGVFCDMPTLFERVRVAGGATIAYPMHEPWLDVGRPDDLEKAYHAVAPAYAEPGEGQ